MIDGAMGVQVGVESHEGGVGVGVKCRGDGGGGFWIESLTFESEALQHRSALELAGASLGVLVTAC